MNTHEIESQIRQLSLNRFDVVVDESLPTLAAESLDDIRAIKLRRTGPSGATARTILLAFIDDTEHWTDISRWTAQVRDVLPEPETSDLYLFLVAEGFTHHDCSRIESDEQFCRKYVSSGMVDLPGMLERTFLASLSGRREGGKISDPVSVAFQETQVAYPWLLVGEQERWLAAFLTEKPGKDLVPLIIENPTSKVGA